VVVQALAVAGALLALPALRDAAAAPLWIAGLLVADLGILVVFAGWIIAGSVSHPVDRLAKDVIRIADGDYHHRVADPLRPELREIQTSVNRLADRLIADQQLLAENIESLDETNRALRRARDQVVAAARMASVGTLAAGIAHEVGNPLGAIMGFVDVARRRVREQGGDVELLESIRSEAKRIDRIIRGLLDYVRPVGGSESPTPAAEVVSRVREILESQGALGDVAMTWTAGVGSDRLVAQPHRLEQVLINLVVNALHAVGGVDSPRIEVRLGEEEGALHYLPRRREDDPPGVNYMHRRRRALDEESLGSIDAADLVTVIEVLDNGHGIAEDVLEQLFDPFFTTKEPGEGTGLGLSICARLVEGMGGRIDAENREEGGARFVIRLPALYDTTGEDSKEEQQH